MNARFYCQQPIQGTTATLAESEAHHVLHVLRGRAGDEVTLFDGSGYEFLARIEKIGRSTVELSILHAEIVDRESTRAVTIAVALPKGDRQRFLVEKCVELGIRRLVPLETEHSVAQPRSKVLERLRRSVIEACKQCGRNRLMEISEPQLIQEFLLSAEESSNRLIAHPGTANSIDWHLTDSSSVCFAIGPEGGFTEDEVTHATGCGWKIASLGTRILRIETAALALAALCLRG